MVLPGWRLGTFPINLAIGSSLFHSVYLMKLVMTLLVRNESDIIRENIEFHLNHGVDQIIVTDNCSADDTLDILREYEKGGVIRIIQEPSLDYNQTRWVTRMAIIAREELGADWIIHNDADEFWYPDSGDLKSALISTGVDVCVVERVNMLYPWDAEEDLPWHQRLIYKMNSPFDPVEMKNPYVDKMPHPYFCCMQLPKVACVAHGLQEVTQGNHDAVFENEVEKGSCPGILIYHFPFRSKERFLRNTLEIGESYASSPVFKKRPMTGWHKRRWYNLMLEGKFSQVFRETMIAKESLQIGLKEGILVEDRTICNVFS